MPLRGTAGNTMLYMEFSGTAVALGPQTYIAFLPELGHWLFTALALWLFLVLILLL
jgi:hypothetical protein